MITLRGVGTLVISLPGSEVVRSLDASQRSEYLKGLKYNIVFTGPGGAKVERDAHSGNTVSFKLKIGRWNISLKVFNANGREVGSQTKTERVESGKRKSVKNGARHHFLRSLFSISFLLPLN